jgi:hypothetical protein
MSGPSAQDDLGGKVGALWLRFSEHFQNCIQPTIDDGQTQAAKSQRFGGKELGPVDTLYPLPCPAGFDIVYGLMTPTVGSVSAITDSLVGKLSLNSIRFIFLHRGAGRQTLVPSLAVFSLISCRVSRELIPAQEYRICDVCLS